MPLQNRVAPNGELHAVAARGAMLGNRGGRFHRDDQTLGKRRWASTHWIACELHYKAMHHDAMGHGYTSLFFLDEVTALSAGHRPCFYCRRRDAKLFLGKQRVTDFDARLHAERLSSRVAVAVTLPDGTMIETGSAFAAKRRGKWLRWSFEGYVSTLTLSPQAEVKLLTPPLITAILAQGYQPRWHATAQHWDD